jgi:restriction system protein
MNRKRSSELQLEELEWLLPPAGILLFGWVLIENIAAVATIVAVGLVAFGALAFLKRNQKLRREHELCVSIQDAFSQHEKSLVSYYNQSRRADLFGNVDDKKWQGCIDNFLRTNVVTDVANYSAWRKSEFGIKSARIIDGLTSKAAAVLNQQSSLTDAASLDMTPAQYEEYCASLMRSSGWKATVTQAARDGGADFVAENGNVRLVAQCKKYSEPVGNKAVQEVNAAVRLYAGNVACVVAPSGFTKQAQMEAQALGVHLLHHSDLPAFADKISISAKL